MPSDRTFVTEISTALGMLGAPDIAGIITAKPVLLLNLTPEDWVRLESLWDTGLYSREFETGFANGQAFLQAPDALAGRHPRIIEWTGGRRPPGDEVVPSDLRIDHVYLVSCKYLSRILQNSSPVRLVDGLLSSAAVEASGDWYWHIAPSEYQALYAACRNLIGEPDLPRNAEDLNTNNRKRLAIALSGHWPDGAIPAYEDLCRVVSTRTAERWGNRLTPSNRESMFWRLLRIGSAPYFILGSDPSGWMRFRIDTPWDWRQSYRLRGFKVTPLTGGQPLIRWTASYEVKRTREGKVVNGHIELRWSHGRFAKPPEAKVYLDTRHEHVPGYNPI